MERVVVADRPSVDDRCLGIRPLTDPLGATAVALNHFELGSDESPALGLHAHPDQEETFYVVSGAVTVEFAGTDPDGETETVRVAAGEAVRFAPGEYQRVWNREDEAALVLAIGAPQATESADVRNDCPTCDDRTRTEVSAMVEELVCRCADCGTVLRRVERSG
jgi:mannose-6-phosphate isomerase-like protein (cupin superfamily)